MKNFGAVIGLLFALCGCASGSIIITGNPRKAVTPSAVKIYLEAPKEFEVIGLVNASSDAGFSEQASVDYAIEEIKARAAKVGANGVLLLAVGESTTSIVGSSAPGVIYTVPITAKNMQGKAIYVEDPAK